MEVSVVLKFVGKMCRIVLKNNYNYTAVIPSKDKWIGEKVFLIKDKFGENVVIDCEYVAMINEINEEARRERHDD